MRPGYVRPGLTVDEAHRKWNMRLIRKRKERMEKNPVTVETLDNFSNIDKSASKSPRRDMDPT